MARRGGAEQEAGEERFSRLYRAHARDVLAYALPRAGGPEDAADVVAETFLVAWRRIGDVPSGDEGRLWLYGTARRVLANQRRGERRRDRLSSRLGSELAAAVAVPAPQGREGAALLRVLARLGEEDREILMLAGWEELKSPQIARVLGISAVAARVRLHRARRRLRAELAAEEEGAPEVSVKELGLEEGR
ncbi:MAG TPA: RNA polymerase sigma factor [Solirubrobacterales bacterium]|nr:RNA polymerase sigma factor [Solirubrobacterales bacterium]